MIKQLHYEPDDMAIVGKVRRASGGISTKGPNVLQALLDIDIQGEITPEDEAVLADTHGGGTETAQEFDQNDLRKAEMGGESVVEKEEIGGPLGQMVRRDSQPKETTSSSSTKYQGIATPAVRHLVKQHSIKIEEIKGSGKDGRVLKEDVHRHISQPKLSQSETAGPTSQSALPIEVDKKVPLTAIQTAMFKSMTRSLSIPHFLYTTPTGLSPLTTLRNRLNRRRPATASLTPLPFILKAVSQAMLHHPLLNSSLDTSSDPKKPSLTRHARHDFGIAVDTPAGLVVPVIRNVQCKSVAELAAEIRVLGTAAKEGALKPGDFAGATFTVSNIGSIGGGAVAPVIVEPQVAILGVGRGRTVPGFADDGSGELKVVQREEAIFSWSADHRVVDGAECARCAERVRGLLEDVEAWVLDMR